MQLLEESHIKAKEIDWHETIGVIDDATRCLLQKDFSQPVKPYLRYRNLKNRIIAMPAFVGGDINMAGIKWIASFPGNVDNGKPRAHSVVILNDADTGEPVSIICTALLSIIRTASVSGLMIKYYDKCKKPGSLRIGITGFGPIGQHHLKMCKAILGERIETILVYDIRPVDHAVAEAGDKVRKVGSWQEAYEGADIFITCTVADAPYIDQAPKAGSLHINASLRDYRTSVYEWFKDSIIVDDWDEVCREKTDIEMMHLEKGLNREQTRSITDVVRDGCLGNYSADTPILFNPMGMAVFDIAMGNYYYRLNQ